MALHCVEPLHTVMVLALISEFICQQREDAGVHGQRLPEAAAANMLQPVLLLAGKAVQQVLLQQVKDIEVREKDWRVAAVHMYSKSLLVLLGQGETLLHVFACAAGQPGARHRCQRDTHTWCSACTGH